jgi:hypothetical protein
MFSLMANLDSKTWTRGKIENSRNKSGTFVDFQSAFAYIFATFVQRFHHMELLKRQLPAPKVSIISRMSEEMLQSPNVADKSRTY